MLLPNDLGDIDCVRRIFFGETELKGHMNLSDIGVEEDSVLTVVFGPIFPLLTAPNDKTAKVWSAATGECLVTSSGHSDRVFSAVSSADDQQVLTAFWDRTAKVWSAATGECLVTLKGHDGPVCSALFSADGQQVLTASGDQTAKVWSAATGECLLTLKGHSGLVNSAVFSDRGPVGADRFRRQCRECDYWTFITRRRIRASLQIVLTKMICRVVGFVTFPAVYCVC